MKWNVIRISNQWNATYVRWYATDTHTHTRTHVECAPRFILFISYSPDIFIFHFVSLLLHNCMQKYVFEAHVSTHFETVRFDVGPKCAACHDEDMFGDCVRAMIRSRCSGHSKVFFFHIFLFVVSSMRRFSITFCFFSPFVLPGPVWLDRCCYSSFQLLWYVSSYREKIVPMMAFKINGNVWETKKLLRSPPAIESRMANRKLEICVVHAALQQLVACWSGCCAFGREN